MAGQQNIAGQGMTRREIQDLRNRRTGLVIFQLSWIMVFVCLIFVNLQIRGQSPGWPPPGVDQVNPIIPTISTLALAASSWFVGRGVRAVKLDQQDRFLNAWRLAIVLGGLFAAIMTYEWLAVPFSGQYSNVFRLMVGFHGVHALVIGAFLIRVYRNGREGLYHASHFWPVEGAAGLWHFVTIAWIMFYVALFVI